MKNEPAQQLQLVERPVAREAGAALGSADPRARRTGQVFRLFAERRPRSMKVMPRALKR